MVVLSNSVLTRILERISLTSKSGMPIKSEYSCKSFDDPLYQLSKVKKNESTSTHWTSHPLTATSRKPSLNRKTSNKPRSACIAMDLKRSTAENENAFQFKSLPQQEVTKHWDNILIPLSKIRTTSPEKRIHGEPKQEAYIRWETHSFLEHRFAAYWYLWS